MVTIRVEYLIGFLLLATFIGIAVGELGARKHVSLFGKITTGVPDSPITLPSLTPEQASKRGKRKPLKTEHEGTSV